MKEEVENLYALYARKVIDPLEQFIIELQMQPNCPREKVEQLDRLLLEKYLDLENQIQEKYYNTNHDK